MAKVSEMVKVDKKVLEQLENIVNEGNYNMFNYHAVLEEASNLGYYALVDWMANNKEEYLNGILKGFTTEDIGSENTM